MKQEMKIEEFIPIVNEKKRNREILENKSLKSKKQNESLQSASFGGFFVCHGELFCLFLRGFKLWLYNKK